MDFSALQAYVDALHAKQGVPGCRVIVYHHGKPVYSHTAGAVGEDTLYNLYSCTKPVTATAAMQLVEQGSLRLDAPVADYLPEYAEAYVLEDGQRVTVGDLMTVRHLFTMSAGLTYLVNTPAIRALQEACPDATTRQMVATFVEEPLAFRPGARFNYSLCHDVLAAVVEVASGEGFGAYLQGHIFAPLGMDDIGFFPTEEQLGRLATQYMIDENTQVVPAGYNTIGRYRLSTRYQSGGAGLFATADSYGRFAAAMSCGGGPLLRPETVDLLRAEQLGGYVMDNEFSCAAGEGYGYGLGVRTLVDRSAGQRSYLGEFGWDGAAGSYILMDPTPQVAIVYTQHVLGWPARFGCMHAPIRDLTYEALEL